MRTAGIIGGIGPESTIDYYRSIVASYRCAVSDGSYPSVLIDSVDLTTVLTLIERRSYGEVVSYLSAHIANLSRGGADFAALAANTPHIVFNELQRASPIPLISIVEAALRKAVELNVKRVGLLGTRFTMESGFYSDVFAPAGIKVITPPPAQRAYLHDKYVTELVNGIFEQTTREAVVSIIQQLTMLRRIDAVILGGTELPLLLRSAENSAIPMLDTTALHVQEIVVQLLK